MTATREWFKSSFSLSGVDCVEVRHLPGGGVVVRDTKAAGAGPVLSFTATEWQAFLAGVRAGEFDAAGADATSAAAKPAGARPADAATAGAVVTEPVEVG